MNLRDIKKDIEYVLSAFVEDCSVFAAVNPKASDEKLSELIDEAVAVYNELKDKANAKKVEGSKKLYFMQLRQELLQKADALYEKLSAAVKAAASAPAEAPKPAKKAAPAAAKAAPAGEKKAPAAKAAPAAKKAPAKKAPAKKAE